MILHWKARDPSMKISPFSVEDVHCFFLQLATLRSFFFRPVQRQVVYNAPVGCFARILDMDTSNSAVQIVFSLIRHLKSPNLY